MNTCPYCQATEGQVKNGLNPSGTQRWLCRRCRRAYTPEPKPIGYDEATRLEAVQLSVDGMNIRRIGRMLGVNHQSVANWVKAHAASYLLRPSPLRWRPSNWMNCSPLSSRKKASLRHDSR